MALATQDNTITLLSSIKNQKNQSNQQTHAVRINYFDPGCPERVRLEIFISSIFKKYYNAELDHFYPNLISIESHSNTEHAINAVAGVRSAAEESLFSESLRRELAETALRCLILPPGQSEHRLIPAQSMTWQKKLK